MKKRLFVVLAVLALTVCLLPMVVGAEECTHPEAQWKYEPKANPEYHWIKCGICNTLVGDKSGKCNNNCTSECTFCGRDPLNHDPEVIPAVPVTCTSNGYTAGVRCKRANCPSGGILEAPTLIETTGHDIRYANQRPDRSQHYAVCNNCEFEEWQDHNFEGSNSCTARCKACNYQKTENGHVEDDLEAKDPTCTETGLTAGKYCTVCSEITVKQDEIPVLSHAYAAPTCTEPGLCECGAVDPEASSALGHTVGSGIIQHTNGTTHGYTCGRCQDNIVENHKYVGATCKVEGQCICLKTGKLDHNAVPVAAVAPKCEETGLTEGSKCSECGDILLAQEIVAATGHDWDDGVVIKQATGFATGIKLYTCKNDPSHTYEKATPVLYVPDDPNLDRVPRTGNAFIEWLYALIAG